MGMGFSSPVAYPGSYLMNVELSTAEVVERNATGQPVHLCLTSVNDVGRFVVAALDLDPSTWPGEFRMYGDRRTVSEILQWAEAVRGGEQLFFLSRYEFANFSQGHYSPRTSSRLEICRHISSTLPTTKTMRRLLVFKSSLQLSKGVTTSHNPTSTLWLTSSQPRFGTGSRLTGPLNRIDDVKQWK
jgi:hypothetical protein